MNPFAFMASRNQSRQSRRFASPGATTRSPGASERRTPAAGSRIAVRYWSIVPFQKSVMFGSFQNCHWRTRPPYLSIAARTKSVQKQVSAGGSPTAGFAGREEAQGGV